MPRVDHPQQTKERSATMTDAAQLPMPGDSRRDLPQTRDARMPQQYVPPAAADPGVDDDTIDLREYWQILLRHKWTIALVVALSLGLALIATFNTTPIYKATTLVQIDRTGNQVVEYGDVTGDSAIARDAEFYTTQYELLKSRSLARRVIDQIGLRTVERGDEPSFLDQAKASLRGLIATFTSAGGEPQEAGGPRSEGAKRKAEEDLLLENLTISPVRNSRLVRISYESPYPAEAAAVANAVANNYINMNLERRYDASSYAKQFLQEQLEQTRATLEESEKRFVAYAREREIVNFEDRLEILRNQLREMNSELVQVEAERFAAEAEYEELLETEGEGAPGLLSSSLIQTLKERRGALQAEYQENLEVFKPGYPKMQQLQRQINELNAGIARETGSIRESIRSRFQAKVLEEAKLRQRIQEVKEEALVLQDRTTDYETLRREVETNRELYDGLLQRMKEVGVAAGVGENNISVVDAALVPSAPYKPNLKRNLSIALVLGLFLGGGLAFLLNALDDTLKSAEEIERLTGAPVLSLIPYLSPREAGISDEEFPLIAFKDPTSAVAEAVRSLRTSLLFSTAEGAPKLMHFCSASPGEGKTTSAVSTAIAFAQAGAKVLLIDADLRNPSLHKAFSLPNTKGLTNHLAGDAGPAEIAQPTQVPRLFAITSGPLPPNPVELLSTAKMVDLLSLAAERFDQVILDSPPVIGLADALMLANLAQCTVLMVEPGTTRKRDLEGAVKRLYQANARIMGSVLTKVGRAGHQGATATATATVITIFTATAAAATSRRCPSRNRPDRQDHDRAAGRPRPRVLPRPPRLRACRRPGARAAARVPPHARRAGRGAVAGAHRCDGGAAVGHAAGAAGGGKVLYPPCPAEPARGSLPLPGAAARRQRRGDPGALQAADRHVPPGPLGGAERVRPCLREPAERGLPHAARPRGAGRLRPQSAGGAARGAGGGALPAAELHRPAGGPGTLAAARPDAAPAAHAAGAGGGHAARRHLLGDPARRRPDAAVDWVGSGDTAGGTAALPAQRRAGDRFICASNRGRRRDAGRGSARTPGHAAGGAGGDGAGRARRRAFEARGRRRHGATARGCRQRRGHRGAAPAGRAGCGRTCSAHRWADGGRDSDRGT